jgi:putative transposase
LQSLIELNGFSDPKDFQREHSKWVEQGLENGLSIRDERWSESIAVGTLGFAEKVKNELGFKAAHRDVIQAVGSYALREPTEAYRLNLTAENEALRYPNTFFWDESVDEATI